MQNCTCGAKQLVDVSTATTSWKLVGRVRLEANLQNLARTSERYSETCAEQQARCLCYLLHDQHDDQLAVADLGAANDEWARLTQFRLGFQQ
jgi:hypothetical protein